MDAIQNRFEQERRTANRTHKEAKATATTAHTAAMKLADGAHLAAMRYARSERQKARDAHDGA